MEVRQREGREGKEEQEGQEEEKEGMGMGSGGGVRGWWCALASMRMSMRMDRVCFDRLLSLSVVVCVVGTREREVSAGTPRPASRRFFLLLLPAHSSLPLPHSQSLTNSLPASSTKPSSSTFTSSSPSTSTAVAGQGAQARKNAKRNAAEKAAKAAAEEARLAALAAHRRGVEGERMAGELI
ncbi:hypothetical protein B0H13DRAFT_2679407 [Mycena leptocephala]|nr:hypothetical protein B0H13DRAFT_2679407 [Mycena leptocephala]